MSEQQEKQGISGMGVVGGVAGGVGAGVIANNVITSGAVKKALVQDPKATEKFSKAVGDILNAQPKLGRLDESIGALSEVGAAAQVNRMKFFVDPKNKGRFGMAFSDGTGAHAITGIKKLPEGIVAGKKITDPAAIAKIFEGGDKSVAAGIVKGGDKQLVQGLRKAGGMGFGLKNMGLQGRATVAAVTVAGVVAGALVLHSIFGGKHSDKAKQDQQQRQQGGAALGA